MVEETVCLQCGDRGYDNAFVYCIRCLNFAVHRYCLDVVPETFEEFVSWLCDDCNLKAQKQCAVIKHDAIPFQTKHHDVSKYIEDGNKENRLVVAEANEHVHEDGSEQTCDACAKSDFVECGESASQHTSVQLDGKIDGNAILLIKDVSKRFQFEEEKVDGNLTEHIQLSAGCQMPKKRKIKIRIKKRQTNIRESTTEKDQDRLATASYDECLKVDYAKECARLTGGSTLASKVKENEFLGPKDETCHSKPFDHIDDPAIVGVPADHPVISNNGPSRCLKKDGVKKDGTAILLPEVVCKRSQLEDERVERNLIEPIQLSVGWLMQKKRKIRIKMKKSEINNRDSTTEKDQDRLATTFSDEGVKVDIEECTRLASDSALPSKVKENEFSELKEQKCLSKPSNSISDPVIVNEPSTFLEKEGDDVSKGSQFEEEMVEGHLIEPIELSDCCLKQKRKERAGNITESTTEKDQHRLAIASCDEHVKVDVNKCTRSPSDSTLPSTVKDNECSVQKEHTCVSKSFDSISDLGITGVPANHPVISSDGPSVSLRNDGNDFLLPADVSSRSQLEEEKIEGILIEPIDFSAGCLNQKENKIKRKKKRKRIVIESTTEKKDQHRLGTISYDKCVEVDINGCTRPACDSTLPSKAKENKCSEQKDQTRVSKFIDSITDMFITGIPADHEVMSSNGPSVSFENDGNGILLPDNVSTQSQLEEEKIEGNLIEPIDLSAGCLNQKEKKLKRKKQRKKNNMESATKEDEQRLAPVSYDERVKVDVNKCTRSANDSALSSKVKKNEPTTQKKQSCVSKPFDSITDLGVTGLLADHSVISTNRASMSLKKDGYGTLLPADVSSRSQLKEEKIEGNLIEPVDLSADCLNEKEKKIKRKKKRKKIIIECTTEKDQHILASASYDSDVKVDIDDCTILACNSTLPSKVKENKFSAQKDHTCASKRIDSLANLGIMGVHADHSVISSNGVSMSLKNDGKGILPPENVSTQSQLQEEKIEGNLIEPINLSAGCLNQKENKIKRKKQRKRNIMESTTEKDQHRLATEFYDERVKVDVNECTQSASGLTLPSKVKENGCFQQKEQTCLSKSFDSNTNLDIADVPADHPVISSNGPSMSLQNDGNDILLPTDDISRSQLEKEKIVGNTIESLDLSAGCLKQKKKKIKRKKKSQINIMESTTENDEQRLATTSCDERMNVDFNECIRSADHPVISSDGPSRTLKKKKTITSSATIPQEQLHPTGVAQPLHKNKDLYLERDSAVLSTGERDLGSINNPIEIREGPEEKVEQTSTTCQNKDACFSVAQPIAMPIWRGSFSISNEKYANIDLLNAHISNNACHRVYEAASQFQSVLHLEMHPKLDIWPKSFQTAEPNHENIALYFFPSKISEQVFEQLVGEMLHKELALRAFVQNAELLIFTSTELPLLYWTFRGKYYLWGIFKGKSGPPSNNLSSKEVMKSH